MAQLTNKCTDDDIEYFIRECGDIMGLSQFIQHPDDPKAILHYLFQEIVKYKSSNLSWSGDDDQNQGRRSNASNAANTNGASE